MANVTTYAWVPNDGPLTISTTQGAIGSLYLDRADITIAFSATPTPPNGNPFYTILPPGLTFTSNPQVVPMPAGTTSVSLSGTSAEVYYILAQSGVYRPSMEGPSLV
jgi:hypothetical protein